jgi:hypothetical protein
MTFSLSIRVLFDGKPKRRSAANHRRVLYVPIGAFCDLLEWSGAVAPQPTQKTLFLVSFRSSSRSALHEKQDKVRGCRWPIPPHHRAPSPTVALKWPPRVRRRAFVSAITIICFHRALEGQLDRSVSLRLNYARPSMV